MVGLFVLECYHLTRYKGNPTVTYTSLNKSRGLIKGGETDVHVEWQGDFTRQLNCAVLDKRNDFVRSRTVVQGMVCVGRRQFLGQRKSEWPAVRSGRDVLDFLFMKYGMSIASKKKDHGTYCLMTEERGLLFEHVMLHVHFEGRYADIDCEIHRCSDSFFRNRDTYALIPTTLTPTWSTSIPLPPTFNCTSPTIVSPA